MDAVTETLGPLPGTSARGEPGQVGVKPVVVIDTREQTPLVFKRLPSVVDTLGTADYSFRGGETLFAVERKSVQDLVGCCTGDNRERFERELMRLRGFRFKRLLIVGATGEVSAQHYRGNVSPKAVLATLYAFEARYDLPVVWTTTPEDAALKIESWAWWFSRELVKAANAILKADPTPQHPRAEPGRQRRQAPYGLVWS